MNAHIDHLRPNTKYEFDVRIVKGRNQSPWSMKEINTTMEAGTERERQRQRDTEKETEREKGQKQRKEKEGLNTETDRKTEREREREIFLRCLFHIVIYFF